MTKNELKNLKIGDRVVITTHGKNQGKMGIVNGVYDWGAYLEPFQCEFEFSKSTHKLTDENGNYGFNVGSIAYPKKQIKKEFYVCTMFAGDEVSWSANNFTEKELDIIERFLSELNGRIEGKCIDGISIIDEDVD